MKMKKYKSYKVKIGDNPALSKAIQNHAFSLGYEWELHGQKIKYQEKTWLYFSERGFVLHGMSNVPGIVDVNKKTPPLQFFKLTKDDVVTEPEMNGYEFKKQTHIATPIYKLTKDEADDVVHYIEKIVKERES